MVILMQEKIKLRTQLNDLKTKIEEFYDSNLTINNDNKKKLEALYEEYLKINDHLLMLNLHFVIGNNIVELYKENKNDVVGEYIICLPKSSTIVGSIDYRQGNLFIGNIGYKIKEKYRGNNYAYYATHLLLNNLCQNQIDQVVISANINNIASIKTLDKLKEAGLQCNVIEHKEDFIKSYHYNLVKEMFLNNQSTNKNKISI